MERSWSEQGHQAPDLSLLVLLDVILLLVFPYSLWGGRGNPLLPLYLDVLQNEKWLFLTKCLGAEG